MGFWAGVLGEGSEAVAVQRLGQVPVFSHRRHPFSLAAAVNEPSKDPLYQHDTGAAAALPLLVLPAADRQYIGLSCHRAAAVLLETLRSNARAGVGGDSGLGHASAAVQMMQDLVKMLGAGPHDPHSHDRPYSCPKVRSVCPPVSHCNLNCILPFGR